jgi:hypothetical protein
MANQSEQTRQVSLGDDFGAAVITLNGLRLEVGADGKSVRVVSANPVQLSYAANENKTPLVQRALEVGERLRDGTVVLSVDLDKNVALFVPAKIFGGEAKFGHQDNVVKSANRDGLHGHKDWRLITDAEGETLSKAWDKVAPTELQGRAAPWLWLASPVYKVDRLVRRGGEADWNYFYRGVSTPVPVVRSGPARS